MTKFFAAVALEMLASSIAMADNTQFEATLHEGWEIYLNFEPPATVMVAQRKEDGSLVNVSEYENEGCKLAPSKLTCSRQGKSPLAGTTYIYRKLVGNIDRCFQEPVYAVYECVKGCGRSKLTPRFIHEISICE